MKSKEEREQIKAEEKAAREATYRDEARAAEEQRHDHDVEKKEDDRK